MVRKYPPRSTGLLADWYATLALVDHMDLILAVSAKTLLPVVVLAEETQTFPERLPTAVGEVLSALGVPRAAIQRELGHMVEHNYAKTADRRVVASIVEYVRLLECELKPGTSLVRAALRLAEAPMGVIRMNSADNETLRRFRCSMPRGRPKAARALDVRKLKTPDSGSATVLAFPAKSEHGARVHPGQGILDADEGPDRDGEP
jgi:hypothetical protein